MDRPGVRYKNLASRCRLFAAACNATDQASALRRMADAYDQRADQLEDEKEKEVERAKQADLPLLPHS